MRQSFDRLSNIISRLDKEMIIEINEYVLIPPIVLNILFGVCSVLGYKAN